jgi:O-antigen/teichoic acid export membrane protein
MQLMIQRISKVLLGLKRPIVLRSGVAATTQTLLVNILILGLGVVTGIVTARVLGPNGRGELAALIVGPQFLAHALTLGLPDALVYNHKRYPDRAPQLFSAALFLGIFMGAVATLIGVLLIPYWLTEYSPAVIRFAQLIMLLAPVGLMALILTSALQSREEFALYNAMRYLPPLLTLLALIVLVLRQSLTPFSAALSYVLPAVPVVLWMLARLWKLYRPHWNGLRLAANNLTSYGLRSSGIDFTGTLAYYLDRVLLVGLLAPGSMGLYVVALSLARMLNVFHTAVASVLFTKMSGRPAEEVVGLTGMAARVSTALTLLAALGLAGFGPQILSLVYGQQFLGAVTVFRLLVLEVVLLGMAWVLAQAFMALGKPGWVTLLQGVGLSISVPLLLVLVPPYGLEGAGLALLISATLRLVLALLSFPLILKMRIPRLWLTRTDIHAILHREE